MFDYNCLLRKKSDNFTDAERSGAWLQFWV